MCMFFYDLDLLFFLINYLNRDDLFDVDNLNTDRQNKKKRLS